MGMAQVGLLLKVKKNLNMQKDAHKIGKLGTQKNQNLFQKLNFSNIFFSLKITFFCTKKEALSSPNAENILKN